MASRRKGDFLHPLHHLLASNDDAMPLAKNTFQRVIGDVVVKATEQEIHRHSQPQVALVHQPGRHGGNVNSLRPAGAVMGMLGSHRFFADEFGWKVFVFGGGFLAYPPSLLMALAANLVLRFRSEEHTSEL